MILVHMQSIMLLYYNIYFRNWEAGEARLFTIPTSDPFALKAKAYTSMYIHTAPVQMHSGLSGTPIKVV